MPITTLDGVIAGMLPPRDFMKIGGTMEAAGQMHSFFYGTGVPAAAAQPSPGMSGAALTSYAGQLPWTNPSNGLSYLARLQASCSLAGSLFLCDRLWHNSGIAVTTLTEQTINSVAFPARDINGLTSGTGILIGLEVYGATTNAGAIANISYKYTNSAGDIDKVATIASFPATAAAGTFVPFPLAAGDLGVRTVQSITLGTSLVTGSVHLVAYRILSKLDIMVANIGQSVDPITSGFVRLHDNTVPFLTFIPTATTACVVNGQMIVTQG